jgi:ADP-heptose:LPS heptosyltransferase
MTPSFRAIKEAYPDAWITVNTHRQALLQGNPYVDQVGREDKGLPVRYMDPFHCKSPEMWPKKHHILTDWEIITGHYGLTTPEPRLVPELYYYNGSPMRQGIGVQIDHKPHWHHKRVWPFFEELAVQDAIDGHEVLPIHYFTSFKGLVSFIASLRLVVCAEGGVQHLAAALGVPALVIFGGFSSPEWNGYPFNRNLVNLKECSYCYNPFPCPAPVERECMREITVPMVVEAIREELAK